MRPLLSRGALIGGMLLAVVAMGQATPPQHAAPRRPALLAQSASTVSLPISDPAPEPNPRRLIPPPPATPSAQPQAMARLVAQATVRSKPAPAPAAPPQVAVGTGQWGLINQDRQAAGLAPLQWSPCLANVATGQATRMAAQGYISHANGRILDLGCHLGSRSGENIGFQGGGINDAGMNAWFMGDPPHRANILGPYHYVGVAWVSAPNGTAYLAVEFG
ncbi:MAG: CAP domain-containing protein [Candidatus Dormibacteraeota bacterium]|nr:CAP domain-containing protein [Candidatus Dormibacteraeota bacterium]